VEKARSPLWTDVDYDAPGKQVGFLHLPHSVTRSAYGTIPIPLAVIANGSGPTVLLMAGNHGDEYEGQAALCDFVRKVDPAEVQGRIIVLPATNLPAAVAGTRTSPLDEGNLNRAFPGDPTDGPTGKIAHYLDTVLFPMCDATHDFHSGGASLDYLTLATMRLSGDADLDRRARAALDAFAPPLAMVWAFTNEPTLSAACALSHKLIALGGEFGGRGAVRLEGIRVIEAGMRRFLDHLGVMEAPADLPPPPRPRYVEVPDRSYYVYAPERGLFVQAVDLGAEVEAGDLAGHIYFPEDPGRAPVPCHFRQSGLVICQRAMGRAERGDCVFHLARDID